MTLFKSWVELALALISLGSLVWSGILYFQSKVEKEYAAKRDFEHIKNNMKQYAANVELLTGELDDIHDELKLELKEIKACVQSLSVRFDSIWSRLDANSGIFRRHDQ